jgi:hypothetical protein
MPLVVDTFKAGTIDATQSITINGESVGPKYKVYVALLTQTGSSAPTAIVLENTLGGDVIWSRTSDGVYYATLVGAFPDENKFFTLNSITEISSSNISVYWNDSDSFQLNTYSGNGPYAPQDNIIFKYPIEIRVYNSNY